MSVIKNTKFPYRLPINRLRELYASLEMAFASHDYVYVSRYGQNDPELRACALIMLGNRVGGEHILDQQNIKTPRSFLYRAYTAWQHDDEAEAKRWITEARKLGTKDVRFDRLETLIQRHDFRILFHTDFDGKTVIKTFSELPDFDVVITKYLEKDGPNKLFFDQPLRSIVPTNDKFDFVLLDDLKITPLGVKDFNAPVIAVVHDNEWYHDYLDKVMPEIDLISTGATSDMIEIGRAFNCPATIYFYHLPFQMSALKYTLKENFSRTTQRTTDLFYTSSAICHDFYRYKRQELLSLFKLSDEFDVKIGSKSYPYEEYIEGIEKSRFTLNLTRGANALPTRAIEALKCGALHLVEEDNGFPFLFSEHFSCFPTYKHESILADVENYLHHYDQLLCSFRSQLPRFEQEFDALLPANDKIRATRYLKHLLFITKVEMDGGLRPTQEATPLKRNQVYMSQIDYLMNFPDQLERYAKQIPPPHWLRRAFAKGRLAQAQGKSMEESLWAIIREIRQGKIELPDSLALHHIEGLCLRFLGLNEEAKINFTAVTSQKLRLYPNDPPSMRLGRFNSYFWVNDARIRADCPKDLEQLVPPENIWISYAYANLADMTFSQSIEALIKTREYAEKSLEFFMYNDAGQRVYLRALYSLAFYEKKWINIFLDTFNTASGMDYTIFHDFAALAIHLFIIKGEPNEANKIRENLLRYIKRIELTAYEHILYPETIPLLKKYNLPHSNMKKT